LSWATSIQSISPKLISKINSNINLLSILIFLVIAILVSPSKFCKPFFSYLNYIYKPS
jgi:hypothetical protein